MIEGKIVICSVVTQVKEISEGQKWNRDYFEVAECNNLCSVLFDEGIS